MGPSLGTLGVQQLRHPGRVRPASTFKSVAYVLALEEGIYALEGNAQTDDATYFCDGQAEFGFTDGSPQVLNDWVLSGHADVDLHTGLQSSCDLYFWQIALNIWTTAGEPRGTIAEDLLQKWARLFGFDEPTGIDLPFEQDGLIPDWEWFERAQIETPELVRDGPWTGGDVLNTVIGQGSVLVTPLQLANAYAAMVNGGTLWQPRVVDHAVNETRATVCEPAGGARRGRPVAAGGGVSAPRPAAGHQRTGGHGSGRLRRLRTRARGGRRQDRHRRGHQGGNRRRGRRHRSVHRRGADQRPPLCGRGGDRARRERRADRRPTAVPVLQYLLNGEISGQQIEVEEGVTD